MFKVHSVHSWFAMFTPSLKDINLMKHAFILFSLLIAFAGCQRAVPQSAVPAGISYLPREAWGANAPVLAMQPHKISRITIHHTATRQNPAKPLGDKMLALQKFSQNEGSLADGRTKPAWADVPYHLYLDCNGAVAEGRDIDYAGDSNTAYDPAGHLLVVVEGNFSAEELTEKQRLTLEELVPALAKRYHVAADSIGGHQDFAQTQCPGTELYALLPQLRQLVASQR